MSTTYQVFPIEPWSQSCGLMMTGPSPGTATQLGQITDLRVYAYSNDSIELTWQYAEMYDGQINTIWFSTFVNGSFYSKTRSLKQVVGDLDFEAQTDVQVIITEPRNFNNPGWVYLPPTTGSRIHLEWPDSISEISHYNVYWNDGAGPVDEVTVLATSGISDYVTGRLENGTYDFLVKAEDPYENESINGIPILAATVAAIPEILEDLAISYSPGTEKATITWTGDASVPTVNIYHNFGSASDLSPDRFTPIDTTTGISGTWTSDVLTAGTWRFVVRAQNLYGIEKNLLVLELLLTGSPPEEDIPSNPPFSIWATTEPAGAINVYALVDSTADKVRVFGDLRTTTVNYGVVLKEIDVNFNAQTDGTDKRVEITLTAGELGAGDGPYTLGVRTVSALGIEEGNIDKVVQVESRAALPQMPTDGTAVVIW